MGKVFDWFLGFFFVMLPIGMGVGLGFVYSWDYSQLFSRFPNDPFALGAAGVAVVYFLVIGWVISKMIRVAKANKKKT